MARNEIETVLANWISQALSKPGQLPEGTDPAAWASFSLCRMVEGASREGFGRCRNGGNSDQR